MFGLYKILGVAKIEANKDEHVVVYQSLSNKQLWTRPVWEFISEVPDKYMKDPFHYQKYRFEIFKGSEEEVTEITTLLNQNISTYKYRSKEGDNCGSSEEKN